MRRSLIALAVLATLSAACSSKGAETTTATVPPTTVASTTTTTPTTQPATTSSTIAPTTTTTTVAPLPLNDLELSLAEVASGFTQPVFVTAPPGDDRLFVVGQGGAIEVLRGEQRLGTFLDLSGRVVFRGEQGLLGLAFHPDYPQDGRFYVDYTDPNGTSVVAEYRVSADPDRADPASERVLLTVPQPAGNHNGGMIAFGPDGSLYVALGDGGGSGDAYGNGQNPVTLLGAILRIDVDGNPYAVPPDNPFAAGGGAPEIWAYGLRNPWRFSFDGDLVYIADVGQSDWEEVDLAHVRSRGLNFGWPVMEGVHCYQSADCDTTGLTLPALEYDHSAGNCSITGGYVYRGQAIPELAGAYFYGDFCSGMIASFRADAEGIFERRDWSDALGRVPGLTSFGVDGVGEIYLASTNGSVYRIERG